MTAVPLFPEATPTRSDAAGCECISSALPSAAHRDLRGDMPILRIAVPSTCCLPPARRRRRHDHSNPKLTRATGPCGRTADESHYSPLSEINRETVGRLKLAWTLISTLLARSPRPLAVDGVAVVAAGYSVVHAVDAATGKVLWKFDPGVTQVCRQEAAARAPAFAARVSAGAAVRGHARWSAHRARCKKGRAAVEPPHARCHDSTFISGAPRVIKGWSPSASVIR